MPKCDFNKVAEIALWHGCSPVDLLHTFRTPFPRNPSGGLLLEFFSDLIRFHLPIVLSDISCKLQNYPGVCSLM